MAQVLDPSTWTADNREDKLAEIRKIAEDVSTMTELFVKELLEKSLDGRSVLWWKVLDQFIAGEVEMLVGFRDELDTVDREALDALPVSYDWLSSNIFKRNLESTELNAKLAQSLEPVVEEL